jgi:hypothetical protein
MEPEIIMLSKVSQVQKENGYPFSLICGRQSQRMNVYTNTNMIIHTYVWNTFAIVGLYEGARRRGRGKENERE